MYRVLDSEQIRDFYPNRVPIYDSLQLEKYLRDRVQKVSSERKVAIALSGGIDSAILAKFMPHDSIAYTFKCIVPGVDVVDETPQAALYAEKCGLKHKIIEIYWDDFERYSNVLMEQINAPFHSICVQIYKAALIAKDDGVDTLVFGESADTIYGGFDGLLSKEWKVGDFIQRYCYIMPHLVLRDPVLPTNVFLQKEEDGYIDPHRFVSDLFM